jgi:hypothetical protein
MLIFFCSKEIMREAASVPQQSWRSYLFSKKAQGRLQGIIITTEKIQILIKEEVAIIPGTLRK